MKRAFFPTILCLVLFSCNKDNTPLTISNSNSSPARPQTPPDKSKIAVSIDNNPMTITNFTFDRGSTNVYISAANALQKIELYTFHLYGTSGLNYQYQDSINYSFRADSLSDWQTVTAPNYASCVLYDCCELPTKDNPIDGEFKASFDLHQKGSLTISGTFHLLFK